MFDFLNAVYNDRKSYVFIELLIFNIFVLKTNKRLS